MNAMHVLLAAFCLGLACPSLAGAAAKEKAEPTVIGQDDSRYKYDYDGWGKLDPLVMEGYAYKFIPAHVDTDSLSAKMREVVEACEGRCRLAVETKTGKFMGIMMPERIGHHGLRSEPMDQTLLAAIKIANASQSSRHPKTYELAYDDWKTFSDERVSFQYPRGYEVSTDHGGGIERWVITYARFRGGEWMLMGGMKILGHWTWDYSLSDEKKKLEEDPEATNVKLESIGRFNCVTYRTESKPYGDELRWTSGAQCTVDFTHYFSAVAYYFSTPEKGFDYPENKLVDVNFTRFLKGVKFK